MSDTIAAAAAASSKPQLVFEPKDADEVKLAKKKRKAERELAKQDEIIAARRASDKEKSKLPYTYVPGSGMIDFTELDAQQKAFFEAEDAAIAATLSSKKRKVLTDEEKEAKKARKEAAAEEKNDNDPDFASMVEKVQTNGKKPKKLSDKVKEAMAPLDRESDLFARQAAGIKAHHEEEKKAIKGFGTAKTPSQARLAITDDPNLEVYIAAPAKKPRARSTINKSLVTQIALFDKKIDRFFPDMDHVPVLIAPMWTELQEFWDESKYMIALITGRIQPNLNFSGDMASDRKKMHRVYCAFVNFRQHTKRLQAAIAESKA